jgi:HipA-like protein
MSEILYVHYENQTIGELQLAESGHMQFRYRTGWQQNESAFPISISLPLNGEYDLITSHRFFANLLPEANVRQQICQSLKISLATILNCSKRSAATVPEHSPSRAVSNPSNESTI